MMPLWLRGTLLLAVVFAAGIAVGVLAERSRHGADGGAMTTRAMNPDTALAALDRQLSLDSAQRRVVGAVLRRRQSAIDSAWRVLRPGLAAAVDSTQMEIYDALRPDQRQAFLDMMRRTHPGMSSPRGSAR